MIKKNSLKTLFLFCSLFTIQTHAANTENIEVFSEAWSKTAYLSEMQTILYCVGTKMDKSLYLKSYSVEVQNGIPTGRFKSLTKEWIPCTETKTTAPNFLLCSNKKQKFQIWLDVDTADNIVNKVFFGHPKEIGKSENIQKTLVHSNALSCNGAP